MRNKYFLYVEGDTNEDDYIGKLSELSDVSENKAKEIARKLTSFHENVFTDPSIDEDEAVDLKENFVPYNNDTGGYCNDITTVQLIKGETVPFPFA